MRVFFSGEDRNFDGDIRRRIGIENNAFQKLRKGNKDKRGEILCNIRSLHPVSETSDL